MLPVQTNSTLIFFMRHPDGSTIIRTVMAQADRQSIVILTGAGISKESGLDTFRDPDGI